MKKIVLTGLIFALTIVVLGVSSQETAKADAAVVVKDIGCGLLDGDGNFAFTSESHAVSTNSGNSKITCKADVAPSTTQKSAVKWNFANTGLLCSTAFGVTEDWEEVVTPSGKASIVCHINPNPTP